MENYLVDSEKPQGEEVVKFNKYGVPYINLEAQENQCNPGILLKLEVFLFALWVATISFFTRCKFVIKNFMGRIFEI